MRNRQYDLTHFIPYNPYFCLFFFPEQLKDETSIGRGSRLALNPKQSYHLNQEKPGATCHLGCFLTNTKGCTPVCLYSLLRSNSCKCCKVNTKERKKLKRENT